MISPYALSLVFVCTIQSYKHSYLYKLVQDNYRGILHFVSIQSFMTKFLSGIQ